MTFRASNEHLQKNKEDFQLLCSKGSSSFKEWNSVLLMGTLLSSCLLPGHNPPPLLHILRTWEVFENNIWKTFQAMTSDPFFQKSSWWCAWERLIFFLQEGIPNIWECYFLFSVKYVNKRNQQRATSWGQALSYLSSMGIEADVLSHRVARDVWCHVEDLKLLSEEGAVWDISPVVGFSH